MHTNVLTLTMFFLIRVYSGWSDQDTVVERSQRTAILISFSEILWDDSEILTI